MIEMIDNIISHIQKTRATLSNYLYTTVQHWDQLHRRYFRRTRYMQIPRSCSEYIKLVLVGYIMSYEVCACLSGSKFHSIFRHADYPNNVLVGICIWCPIICACRTATKHKTQNWKIYERVILSIYKVQSRRGDTVLEEGITILAYSHAMSLLKTS